MSSPVNSLSLDAETGENVDGRATRAMGHPHIGVFVHDAADGSFEVHFEASPDGEHWGVIQNGGGEDIIVTHDDLNANGSVYRHVSGSYAEFLRARLVDNNGGEVSAWVLAAGNAGQGRKGVGRSGPVTDLDL